MYVSATRGGKLPFDYFDQSTLRTSSNGLTSEIKLRSQVSRARLRNDIRVCRSTRNFSLFCNNMCLSFLKFLNPYLSVSNPMFTSQEMHPPGHVWYVWFPRLMIAHGGDPLMRSALHAVSLLLLLLLSRSLLSLCWHSLARSFLVSGLEAPSAISSS